MPGENITIHGGYISINDKLLEEDYVQGQMDGKMSVTVTTGNLFLMGDNREHTLGSRMWLKL